jgi:acetylornithine deacetylase/succinyl-diaminopimelate desuccinylase-like protein
LRVPPGESVVAAERELLSAIKGATRKRPALKARPKVLLRAASSLVDLDSPVADEVRRARRGRRGGTIQPFVAGAFTDLRFFVARGIPGIQYGVGGPGQHAINERIRIRDLLLTAKVYATALCNWGR